MADARTMKPGTRYIVTHPSADGEFALGDRIRLCPDGSIDNWAAAGWMPVADVPAATRGMQVEVDHEWVARRRAQLMAEIARLSS